MVAWVFLAYGSTLSVARAQSDGTALISLGVDIAVPGEHASIPVTLASKTPVGKVSFTISFPNQLISFSSATQVPKAQPFELEIRTVLKVLEEKDVLRVDLSSTKQIPPGELVRIQFAMSQEALPNHEFHLKIIELEVQKPEGQEIQATSSDGLIVAVVLGDVIPACFFYMH